MYSISTLVLVGIAALLLGAGIGLLTGRRMTPDTRKQRELERNLDRLLQQQKDYQHEVVEHFTDTSKLLNNLAESYRDVHNHLASGANNLCDDPNWAKCRHPWITRPRRHPLLLASSTKSSVWIKALKPRRRRRPKF